MYQNNNLETDSTERTAPRQTGRISRRGIWGAIFGLAFIVAACCSPSESGRSASIWFLNLERGDHGLHYLAGKKYLNDRATAHSVKMCKADGLFHSNLANNYGGQYWTRLGENVGRTRINTKKKPTDAQIIDAVLRLQDAFMASSGHRANMLDSRFTDIGVGAVLCKPEGKSYHNIWVTHAFRRR